MAGRLYGIDFGTSTLKIYKKHSGVVFDAKNIIAIANGDKVIAIGDEAFEMLGKAPSNIEVSYPVKNGVIADIDNMISLLNRAFEELEKKYGKIAGSDFIVAAPTDITEVEKRAFYDIVANSMAKTKKIRIVEKPIACALGADLDVTTANGIMMIDIGADTTEISVLSLGGIVISKMITIGGNKLDEVIINNIRKKYNLIIGNKTAENVKKQLAMATACDDVIKMEVCGRDVVNGLPTVKEVTSAFVYETISELLYSLIDAIKIVLEKTPPEIASDIIDSGIYITGGSASIKGLDKLVAEETDLKVNVCDEPGNTVALGIGRIIDEPKLNTLALSLRQTYYGN